MAKKKFKPQPEPGVAPWVVTYGDMMSLLLTFFVLLLSFSSMQEVKFKKAVESLQRALGVFAQSETIIEFDQEPSQGEAAPRNQTIQTTREEVLYEFRKMEQYLLENDLDIEVDLTMTPDGINIKIKDSLLFASGKAKLQKAGIGVLDNLSGLLDGNPNNIRVSGHTDSVPIHTRQFPSNWELSAARAIAVARHFNEMGISPDRLSATGYGEYRPIESNSTAEGRSMNRRVEIFLKYEDDQPTGNLDLPLESEVMNYGG